MKTLIFVSLTVLSSSTYAGRPCPDPEDFTCKIRESCQGPWGRVQNNESIVAYKKPSGRSSSECVYEVRVCQEGTLSGSFIYPSCEISE